VAPSEPTNNHLFTGESAMNKPIELNAHIVPEDQSPQLTIHATDPKGAGNAHHRYTITGYDTESNESATGFEPFNTIILFQNGPIKEVGVNGITHEALLAIVIHRLQCFQSGPYPSEENNQALQGLSHALTALQRRTRMRINRGVEGTNKP
jgi:hypothetical protein